MSQAPRTVPYRLALPDRNGRLEWSAPGFKIVQMSAKPNGAEIGLRGHDDTRRLTFLGFLFVPPEGDGTSSTACRDGALATEKKMNSTLKIQQTSVIERPGGLIVALVSYSATERDRKVGYRLRGFVAAGGVCGDLEFYSEQPIRHDDVTLQAVFRGLQLDPAYVPTFPDVALYAQLLYRQQAYRAAAPVFEKALTLVPPDGAPFTSQALARRVMRDQAGMAWGISGDTAKARAIFEQGIAEDPDYPLYYYNLACADAQEKKLADAQKHLQQAFDRKANMNAGERMPTPTKDDSFIPYKGNKDFWNFLKRLETEK